MASILRAHELDEMNETDLEARLREAKEELFNLRFQAATGQLESHGRLRTVKKDIARIYTVLRERELGIRTTPGATDDESSPPKTQKAPKAAKTQKAEKAEKAEKEGADA